MSVDAQPEIGLAQRLRRGSGLGLHHRGADHRAHLGASRVGHLVDLGRPPHLHVYSLAALRLLFCCCALWWKSRTAARCSASLFGIFAFIDVPLVFGSIRWWRTQHPQPVVMGGSGSGLDPTMWKVFFFSWFAMLALMALLIRARYQMESARGANWKFSAVKSEAQ